MILSGNCDLIITVLSVARTKIEVNTYRPLKKLQRKIDYSEIMQAPFGSLSRNSGVLRVFSSAHEFGKALIFQWKTLSRSFQRQRSLIVRSIIDFIHRIASYAYAKSVRN